MRQTGLPGSRSGTSRFGSLGLAGLISEPNFRIADGNPQYERAYSAIASRKYVTTDDQGDVF